jgi:hypothetical protein
VVPAIATVLAGLASRVPENGEPSEVDMEKVATTVPAAALSLSDVFAGLNLIPVDTGPGGGLTATTPIVNLACSLNRVFIPLAQTVTE